MELIPIFSALAVGAAVLVVLLQVGVSRLRRAKGPPGDWLTGGHVFLLSKHNYHQQLIKWVEAYGPVYKINLGGPSFVISDATLALPLLTRGPDYAPKSAQIYNQTLELTFGIPGIFADSEEGPVWTRVRKAMAPSFSTDALKKAFPHMLHSAQQVADSWQAVLQQEQQQEPGALQEGVVEDVYAGMQRCTLSTLCGAGLDVDINEIGGGPDHFLHVLHHALLDTAIRFVNPFRAPFQKCTQWFLPSSRQALGYYARYRRAVQDLLAIMEKRGPPAADDQSLGANLMRLKGDSPQGPALTRRQLLSQLSTFLIAGFDTSSSALTWALYHIALRPEVQFRCAMELQSLGLLHHAGCPPPAPLTWAHLGKLPYLSAVIKESLRLTSTATGTSRVAPRDMTLAGVHIPKGSKLFVMTAAIQESSVNFLHPKEFLPERWLQQQEGADTPAAVTELTPEPAQSEEAGAPGIVAQPAAEPAQNEVVEAPAEVTQQDPDEAAQSEDAASSKEMEEADAGQATREEVGSIEEGEQADAQQTDAALQQDQEQELNQEQAKGDLQQQQQEQEQEQLSGDDSDMPTAEIHAVRPGDKKGQLQESRPTLSGNAGVPPGKSWLAFSEGPRNCIGQAFAAASLKTVLATLLSRYSFSVHPDTGTPEQVEEQQTQALVMVPGGPIKLYISPRA